MMGERYGFDRLIGSRNGNIAILTALLLPVAVTLCGLVTDLAMLGIQERKLQNAADLAAVSAASHISDGDRVALGTLSDNGLRIAYSREQLLLLELPEPPKGATTRATVERGHYAYDTAIPVAERFTPGRTPYNAVRVSVEESVRRYFTPLSWGESDVTRSAVAATSPGLAYSVGSRLVSLRGGVANKVLSELTGSSVELTAMDYNALAAAEISLLTGIEAVALEAGIKAVSYDDVLRREITLATLAAALERAAPSSASVAAQRLAIDMSDSARKLKLADMLDLGDIGALPLNGEAPFDIHASLMDILSAGILAANHDSQVAIDLAGTVPGLADLDLMLAVGERMQHSGWVKLGRRNDVLHTAQTRLKLVARIGGEPYLPDVELKLPIHAEIARAEAAVGDVACRYNQPAHDRAEILARPGIARLWIGETDRAGFADFSHDLSPTRADILTLPLARVRGSADVEIGNMTPSRLQFSSTDIRDKRVKSVSVSTPTQSLSGSLLQNLDLDVDILGLSLTGDRIGEKVADRLDELTPQLDETLHELLSVLGLRVGEMDVKVHAVHCRFAALAQ